jgi:hypothetical protein
LADKPTVERRKQLKMSGLPFKTSLFSSLWGGRLLSSLVMAGRLEMGNAACSAVGGGFVLAIVSRTTNRQCFHERNRATWAGARFGYQILDHTYEDQHPRISVSR